MIVSGEIIVFRFGVRSVGFRLSIPVTWLGLVQVSKIHALHIYGWVWILISGSGSGMDSTKPDLGILIVISIFEFISHSLATLNSCLSFAAICLYAQNFPSTIILYLLLNNYVIVWYYVILYIQLTSLVWY